MQVLSVTTGPLQENTYIAYEPGMEGALIIDPGDDAADILGVLRQHSLTPVLILLTHGHFDHTGAVMAIQETYGTPVAMHSNDRRLAEGNVPEGKYARFLDGQDELSAGPFSIEVLHTPGHSAGSVCYLIDGVLFSGDTLFQGSIGRTDFPEGSETDMARSLSILRELPGETKVYPGHGPSTTIMQERATNPWMRTR